MTEDQQTSNTLLASEKDVQHAFGTGKNSVRDDSVFVQDGKHVRYYFYPTWRAQLLKLIYYFVFCIVSIKCSQMFDKSIIEGELFRIGDTILYLRLPMFIFLPGAVLVKIFLFIYNAKYIIDERGVEAQIGLVAMNLRQPRLRYEDIRGVEPRQTLWERILGIGSVLIGSAMTDDVEITMVGVANPRAIQLLIGAERDKRLKFIERTLGHKSRADMVLGD
ncbi:MAG: PH domain-containing protein [Deltaproteobacteria bacterium]|nr:PH domain-containing protein [Deltaproteobacteria bacterium]